MIHPDKNIKYKSISFKTSFILVAGLLFIYSCNNQKPAGKEIVEKPELMDEKVNELIAVSLNYASSRKGQLNDSIVLTQDTVVNYLYKQNGYSALWCSSEKWNTAGDSLFNFIELSKQYGLFPSDYHFENLKNIRQLIDADSLSKTIRNDAAAWTRAELMLSDALVSIIKDIKLGRLPNDSITMRKDSVLSNEFIREKFLEISSRNSVTAVLASLEPRHAGYHELKNGINNFLKEATFKEITHIDYPDKDAEKLKAGVIKRFYEIGRIDSSSLQMDSVQLSKLLMEYQKERKLTADGKIGPQTIRDLNITDREKFIRIAITMDRYKMLPEEMPEKYIWVNIPSYSLKLIQNNSEIISSRVVVGKPVTRTPVLTSSIYEMITYPQWNIPQSIIVKEILPALKKDPGYLAKKGYVLVDSKGEEIDPFSVDWRKYNTGVPYRIFQGSGDANALGVLKFNFSNKYAVYLHDTNQRYYFGLDSRAVSHGCIRVQAWEKIAFNILNEDKEYSKKNNKKFISVDSVKYWLAHKIKHQVPVNKKLPVFIRYFTCEGINGRVFFYEDIYNEDLELASRFFKSKRIRI